MLKQSLVCSLLIGALPLFAGCGSDGTTSETLSALRACHDDLNACDLSNDDCATDTQRCVDDVAPGYDVTDADIADDCDDLYELCAEKDLGDVFCKDLSRACRELAYDDDDDDSDSDDYGRDDDDDSDSDDYDDRYDDEDSDSDDYDDDRYDDEDSDDYDDDRYDDDDSDRD